MLRGCSSTLWRRQSVVFSTTSTDDLFFSPSEFLDRSRNLGRWWVREVSTGAVINVDGEAIRTGTHRPALLELEDTR